MTPLAAFVLGVAVGGGLVFVVVNEVVRGLCDELHAARGRRGRDGN